LTQHRRWLDACQRRLLQAAVHAFDRFKIGFLGLSFHGKVIARLHIHPELRRGSKELRKAQRGVGVTGVVSLARRSMRVRGTCSFLASV
jgi:hypothetical protein